MERSLASEFRQSEAAPTCDMTHSPLALLNASLFKLQKFPISPSALSLWPRISIAALGSTNTTPVSTCRLPLGDSRCLLISAIYLYENISAGSEGGGSRDAEG